MPRHCGTRAATAAAIAVALGLSAGGSGMAIASPDVVTLHGTVASHERFCGDEPFSTPVASGVWNLQLKADRGLWSLNLTTDGTKDAAYGGFALPRIDATSFGLPDRLVVTIVDADTVTLDARVAADCTARGYDRVTMTGTIDRGAT